MNTPPDSAIRSCRTAVDLAVAFVVAVILLRTFVLEGYLISTGSMAPVCTVFIAASTARPAASCSPSESPSTNPLPAASAQSRNPPDHADWPPAPTADNPVSMSQTCPITTAISCWFINTSSISALQNAGKQSSFATPPAPGSIRQTRRRAARRNHPHQSR